MNAARLLLCMYSILKTPKNIMKIHCYIAITLVATANGQKLTSEKSAKVGQFINDHSTTRLGVQRKASSTVFVSRKEGNERRLDEAVDTEDDDYYYTTTTTVYYDSDDDGHVDITEADVQTRHYPGDDSWKTPVPTTHHSNTIKCSTPAGKYRKKSFKNNTKNSSKSTKYKSRHSASPSKHYAGHTSSPSQIHSSCSPTKSPRALSPSPTKSPDSNCRFLDCPRPVGEEESPNSPSQQGNGAPSMKPADSPFENNSVGDDIIASECKALDCPRPVNPTEK